MAIPLFVMASLSSLVAGCTEQANLQQRSTPPVSVSVVEVKPEKLPVVTDLPGRISPMITSDVRPRVTGIVLKRVFEQGAEVKEGDVLYVIDQQPFHARVASAKATLNSALAAQQLAQQRASRQTQLLQKGVASQENTDSAVAALAQANADVQRAEADLWTAELDLQYTEVKAPISGRIGRALVTEGALVSPTSDVMAVIQRIDPVYADFTQSADNVIELKSAVSEGRLQADDAGSAAMKLFSAGGRAYPHGGKLLFTEAAVNAATGQVILRAEFPNPDQNLLPGMYVRGRIERAALEGALAVPDQAVQRDTAGLAQLFIVDKDSRVEVRTVALGWLLDGRWVVLKGINAGDKVIVEGFQRIGPGAVVAPEPWTNPTLAQSNGKNGG